MLQLGGNGWKTSGIFGFFWFQCKIPKKKNAEIASNSACLLIQGLETYEMLEC